MIFRDLKTLLDFKPPCDHCPKTTLLWPNSWPYRPEALPDIIHCVTGRVILTEIKFQCNRGHKHRSSRFFFNDMVYVKITRRPRLTYLKTNKKHRVISYKPKSINQIIRFKIRNQYKSAVCKQHGCFAFCLDLPTLRLHTWDFKVSEIIK